MIRTVIQNRNVALVITKAGVLPAKINDAAEAGLKLGLEAVVDISKREFLQGPRPARLGEVTGRLRQSVGYQVQRQDGKIIGTVGTNVVYGAYHEFGFKGFAHVKGFPRVIGKKGKASATFKEVQSVSAHNRQVDYKGRPFVRPALLKGMPIVVAQINKALSKIDP